MADPARRASREAVIPAAALRTAAVGRGGEIQLTDVLTASAESGRPVHAVAFRGRRSDIGGRAGHLRAVVQAAFGRPDVSPGLGAGAEEDVRAGLPSRSGVCE